MMDKNKPSISDAEWKVMKALWRKSPQPAFDVVTELSQTEKWRPNTIKSLLGRLHRKGALNVSKYKNLYLYTPAVSEEQCVAAESQSLIDRIFGGAAKPMLVHLVQRQKLSRADIAELKTILEEKEK